MIDSSKNRLHYLADIGFDDKNRVLYANVWRSDETSPSRSSYSTPATKASTGIFPTSLDALHWLAGWDAFMREGSA